MEKKASENAQPGEIVGRSKVRKPERFGVKKKFVFVWFFFTYWKRRKKESQDKSRSERRLALDFWIFMFWTIDEK